MVTGQLPEAAVERLNVSNADTLIPPRQLAPHLSPLLEKVILTGLNLRVENRFQNAEELIAALQGNFVSPLHKKARNFVENNQLEAAASTYEKCLANESNNATVAIELALVQSHLDDQNAETTAQQALQLNPQEGKAYGILGLIFCRRSQWQEAEQNLKQAIQLTSKESWIYSNLAWALGKQKKWQEAETALKQALVFNPHCAFSLGLQSWIASQKTEWKTAIKGARQALFQLKQNPSLNVSLVKEWVYPCLLIALEKAVVTKNAQDVERCLNEYLNEVPNSSFAWGFKAWKQSQLAINQESLSEFQKASHSNEIPNWVMMNLGLTQEKLGEKSDAIQTYQNVIKQFPNDALAYLRLGTCLTQLRDSDSAMFSSGTGEAIAHLEKSIQLDPTNPCAHHNLAWTRLNAITSSQHQQNYHQIVNTYQKAVQLYHQQSRQDLANQIENAFAKVGITLSNISS